MAWTHLFGRQQIPTGIPTETADRVVATGCAMLVTPASVIASGASEAGKVTTRAQAFEEWLARARDEQDAQLRRQLLVMVCEKADEATPTDRILALVKELHRHTNRS